MAFTAILHKRIAYEEATTLGQYIGDYDKKTSKNELDAFMKEFKKRLKEA